MTEEPSEVANHSAAASVLGYLHQTRWGLLELLRSRASNPDARLSLEIFDDIAWDNSTDQLELKQLKLHVTQVGNLTNASDDLWRTLRVWMDNGRPGDPYGPILTLVTNSSAGPGSAAALLRVTGRDVASAVDILVETAEASDNKNTKKSRQQFLALSPSERFNFVERIYIADQSHDIVGVDQEVAERLRPGAPIEQFDIYLDLVWAWWARMSIGMLRGERPAITVAEMLTSLEGIRDQFNSDNLPSLVDGDEIDVGVTLALHDERIFVNQLRFLDLRPRQLEKAIIDYQKAFLHETRWMDRYLVGYDELEKFSAQLVDEWERAFDYMCSKLPVTATENDKKAAGRELLHLLENSSLAIRERFRDPSHARGRRHALADDRVIFWHPDFEAHLRALLLETV